MREPGATAKPRGTILPIVSIVSALLGGTVGIVLVMAEMSSCSLESPGWFGYAFGAWAVFVAAALLTAGLGGWSRSRPGLIAGLVDLVGFPVLFFVAIIFHVAQCIG